MKNCCFLLLLALAVATPYDGAVARPAAPASTTLAATSSAAWAGNYRFKRKKRKKSRGGLHRKRSGLFGR